MSIKKINSKKSKKKYMNGGEPSSLPTNDDAIPNVITEEQLKEKNSLVTPSKHGGLLGLIITLSIILSTGVTYVITTSKNAIGNVLGIDLSSTTNVNLKDFLAKKINELRDLANDPVTQKNLRELAEKVGVYGGIAINVATPVIRQAMPEIIKITFEGADLLGRSLIKLILDLAGTLPIIGSAIEGVRVVDDTIKSGEAMVGANLQIAEKVSDYYGEFLKKFLELIPSPSNLTPAYLTSLVEKQKNEIANTVTKIRNGTTIGDGTISGGGIKRAKEIKKRIKRSIARFHKTVKTVKTNKRKTRRHHNKA